MSALSEQVIRFKWERSHKADCGAVKNVVEGVWNHPWYHVQGELVYLDSIGRRNKHAHRRWLVWRCNLTDCDAEILVAEDSIGVLLPNGHGDWE